MKELAVQANSDVLSSDQRDMLSVEFEQVQSEFDNLAVSAVFNDIALLDGSLSGAGAMTIQLGIDPTDTISIELPDMRAATVGVDAVAVSIGSGGDPVAAQADIEAALEGVLSERAKVGGMLNRVDSMIENIMVSYNGLSSSKGRIVDTNVAQEMSSYTKNQVMMQASTSMLAQANTQPQNALTLLG